MSKTSDECRKEAVDEMLILLIDAFGRGHCPKLEAIRDGLAEALGEEESVRRQARQAEIPSRHFAHHPSARH